MPSEALALLAAACWAIGSIFSAKASSQMGAFSFTRWRLFFALSVLWALCLFNGQWRSLNTDAVLLLIASGIVGIFVGDTALFACMNRLGPRRCGVLFATHAIFSVALAGIFLGESLLRWAMLGSLLLVAGVMVAIVWGRRADENHDWEQTRGQLRMGIALGLIAALGQAVATLMLKPLMGTGLDAITASAVRVSAAFLAHALLWAGGMRLAQLQNPLNATVLWNTFASALVAMALGMTLILAALRSGQANLVGVFSSVTPVILLPLLWLVYGRRPAWGAWVGAGIAVVGTGMVLLLK